MNENENEMTADEIITHFLKTGKLPWKPEIKAPMEKVTLLKNGNYEIDFRDFVDIVYKTDAFKQWKKLSPKHIELITCNTPNFNRNFDNVFLKHILFFPIHHISILERKDVQKAVFEDHNPKWIYYMKSVALIYVTLALDTENENNITPKDDAYKRRMTFLRSQKKFLDDLLKRIEEIPQQSEKPKPECLSGIITHEKSTDIVKNIKIQYKNIKGKRLKLLLLAFQKLELLPKERIAKKFHNYCKSEFNWDIASYNAMNSYKYNSRVDAEELEKMKQYIKSLLK